MLERKCAGGETLGRREAASSRRNNSSWIKGIGQEFKVCPQPTFQKVCKVAWPDRNLDRLTVRPSDSRVPCRSPLRDIFALEFVEIFYSESQPNPQQPAGPI
ncbi:hypothetical protein D9M68_700920 [compost metagenome]